MTDKTLVDLYDELQTAKAALDWTGSLNTVVLDPAARVSLDVEYESAKNRYFEAEKAYRTAVAHAAK